MQTMSITSRRDRLWPSMVRRRPHRSRPSDVVHPGMDGLCHMQRQLSSGFWFWCAAMWLNTRHLSWPWPIAPGRAVRPQPRRTPLRHAAGKLTFKRDATRSKLIRRPCMPERIMPETRQAAPELTRVGRAGAARCFGNDQVGPPPGWSRYCGPSLAGGEAPGTGGESRATRWNSTRAAGIRSCSRASRASARASAAVGRFRSRARGHSRA